MCFKSADIRFYSMGQKCHRCPEFDVVGNLLALFCFIVFAAFVWKLASISPSTGTMSNRALVSGIVFPHIQLISIEFSLNFSWPAELIAAARALKGLISLDISVLTSSPECAITSSDPMEVWVQKWTMTQVAIYTVLVCFIILRLVLFLFGL